LLWLSQVRETRSVFHRYKRQTSFRRRDLHQQSRLFAGETPSLSPIVCAPTVNADDTTLLAIKGAALLGVCTGRQIGNSAILIEKDRTKKVRVAFPRARSQIQTALFPPSRFPSYSAWRKV
jgi:hypothetical protein